MLPGNTYTLENYVFVCTFRNMVTRRGALSSSQEVNENFSPVSLSYFVIALPGIRKKSGRKNYLRTAIFSLPQTVNLANPKRFPKINNLVRYRYREREILRGENVKNSIIMLLQMFFIWMIRKILLHCTRCLSLGARIKF